MTVKQKRAPILSKQPKDDLDARTIADYQALQKRYVAELRQVRLVIRRAAQQRRAGQQAMARNSGRW